MKKEARVMCTNTYTKVRCTKALIWSCDYFRKYVYALYVCLLFKYIFTMFKEAEDIIGNIQVENKKQPQTD